MFRRSAILFVDAAIYEERNFFLFLWGSGIFVHTDVPYASYKLHVELWFKTIILYYKNAPSFIPKL